ncbi:MAG: VCBS repeat-containing protein [Verrucomicrobiales bacterium]|nr:VCBS repeat-containing protein [Verrucomicrobiales bacterium]
MKTPILLLIAAISLGTFAAPAKESWKVHAIDPADPANHLAGADGIRVGDVNHDGLPDLVTGWEEGKAIRICLHPGKEKVRSPWKAITVGKVQSAEDAVFADLDGDGQLDVVTATEGKKRTVFVHWSPAAEELEDESKWTTAAFPGTKEKQWWMYSVPYDLDHDGDTDLLVGSKNAGGSITWLKNPGKDKARQLDLWEYQKICDAGWIMSMRIFAQGEKTFLLYSDRKGERSGIYLLPLLNESPWLGEPVLIGAAGEEVMFLDIAHLDDDKRTDIVAAIRPRSIRVFYQPENPLQVWEDMADLDPLPKQFGDAKAVRVGLLDEDPIPDFAITCERANGRLKGVLWSNVFSEFTAVSNATGIKYDRIELIDLDGDGDLDLLTCEERAGLGVIWFENPLH